MRCGALTSDMCIEQGFQQRAELVVRPVCALVPPDARGPEECLDCEWLFVACTAWCGCWQVGVRVALDRDVACGPLPPRVCGDAQDGLEACKIDV